MKKYEVVVIGSGSGEIVAGEAASGGFKVAWIDRGPLGGTCMNLGCVPSKTLIYPADTVAAIQEAGKLGIQAEIKDIDFGFIMSRMRNNRAEDQRQMREGILRSKNIDLYEKECHFTGDYTLEADGEKIKGEKIFIAAGSRPWIPPIKGSDSAGCLTSDNLLELRKRPDSLIIIGGGYIAVEYGHFFAAMGVKVTVLELADRLVLAEEPEISDILKKALSRRMDVHTNVEAREIRETGNGLTVVTKNTVTDKLRQFTAQKVLWAVGRRSNADILQLDKNGIETDSRGFIRVNEYLETGRKNIFAFGDIIGKYMFRHQANREAEVATRNAFRGERLKVDYGAVPRAIFSHPQIASVGMTEESARKEHKILVGRKKYSYTAKGIAMMEEEGMAKAIVDEDTRKILGFHIIGPYAPELIQEVINALASDGQLDSIRAGIHIHPALSELIPATLASLE